MYVFDTVGHYIYYNILPTYQVSKYKILEGGEYKLLFVVL